MSSPAQSISLDSVNSFKDAWEDFVTSAGIDPANPTKVQVEKLEKVSKAILLSNFTNGTTCLSNTVEKLDYEKLLNSLGVAPAPVLMQKLIKVDVQMGKLIKIEPFDYKKFYSKIMKMPPPKYFDFKLVAGGKGGIWPGDISILIDDIPEDSIYRKLLACVPLIGIIPTVINEGSLRKKITATSTSPNQLVKLITIKNHYKIASIVRKILTVALVVAVIGQKVLIASAVVGTAFIAHYAYNIYKNRQIIKVLQTGGASSCVLGLT